MKAILAILGFAFFEPGSCWKSSDNNRNNNQWGNHHLRRPDPDFMVVSDGNMCGWESDSKTNRGQKGDDGFGPLECGRAAARLGLQYAGTVSSTLTHNAFPECYIDRKDNKIRFNTNTDFRTWDTNTKEQAGVCYRNERGNHWKDLETGNIYLPAELKSQGEFCDAKSLIKSEADCKKTARKLGMFFKKSVNKNGGFPGCYFADNKNDRSTYSMVFFNRATRTSTRDRNMNAICYSKPELMGAGCQDICGSAAYNKRNDKGPDGELWKKCRLESPVCEKYAKIESQGGLGGCYLSEMDLRGMGLWDLKEKFLGSYDVQRGEDCPKTCDLCIYYDYLTDKIDDEEYVKGMQPYYKKFKAGYGK